MLMLPTVNEPKPFWVGPVPSRIFGRPCRYIERRPDASTDSTWCEVASHRSNRTSMTLTGIFFFLLALLGAVVCQYTHPHLAGTNYQTNDHSRREIVDDKGNIQGQYSYIDPSGSTVNVKYLAGKDGFKILNEPNHQQQSVSQPQSHAQQYQVPVSYQSQKSGKPLQPSFQRQPQPQLFKQHQQTYQEPVSHQIYQEPLHKQVYQQAQEAYQNPSSQPAYQRPTFQSYQASQADLQGFQQVFQQNQDYQQHQYQREIAHASAIPQNLFSPAEHPYPAYTAGQVKSMREFFEDEKAEMEKMEREASSKASQSEPSGQAYVSVKNTNAGYSYDINL